jgi:thiol-disulfide isomerase/thioredoxin
VPDRLLSAVLLCSALGLAACGAGEGGGDAPAASEAAAPGAGPTLTFLDGTSRSVDSYRGGWLVVNYWAEWCAPCREEIPELNALDAARDDVEVIGVNFDALAPAELAPQAEALGIAFPVAVDDPGAVLGLTPPEVLPSTYLFDPEGNLVATLVGPQDEESLRAAIDGAGDA